MQNMQHAQHAQHAQQNVDSFNSVSKFNSLSFRLLLGMLFWLICAFVFTGYTLLLSWELENGGMAINDAGGLRKRTFQMALTHNYATDLAEFRQQQADFELVLYNLRNVGQHKLLLPKNADLSAQVAKIEQDWYKQIKPWYAQLSSPHQLISTDNRVVIDAYANDINRLVKLIEEDNTRNIQLLRVFQMLLIFMTFVTAFTGIFFTYRLVIRPLDTLRGGIVRLALGDWYARVHKSSNDEFGVVSDGFNQMAQSLQDIHHHLEQKVADKTHALAGKNHELTNLYAVTDFLHKAHSIDDMGQGFVSRIVKMAGAQAASIRLLDPQSKKLNDVATQGLPDEMLEPNMQCHHPQQCQCNLLTQQFFEPQHIIQVHPAKPSREPLPCCHSGFKSVYAYPIRFIAQDLGLFTLYFSEDTPMTPESDRLIDALCAQLGVAIENQRLIARDQQFAVSEERNLMAQGLHDSIAQSLSYLNLQVQMLESAIQDKQSQAMDEYLTSIKHGISESYEDVRELLLNFRTRLSEQDFSSAVHTVLQRFEAQSHVQTRLNIVGEGAPLSPRQQLQVIFILQEALSNVRKHARATLVSIDIDNQADFNLRIVDNGVGFDAQAVADKRLRHVGTSIMQERAIQIHAQVNITSQTGQGTQVHLTLPNAQRVVL